MNMRLVPDPKKNLPYARLAFWIFITFSVFYIGVTRGHFIRTDEIALYQTTRSLWEERNLSTGSINNIFLGRHGSSYSQYNAGQSIAALPLYGIGKTLRTIFENLDRKDWIATFSDPSIGQEPSRWGGDRARRTFSAHNSRRYLKKDEQLTLTFNLQTGTIVARRQ